MEIFVEVGMVMAITVIVSGIMRLMKQPLIMGYILTGILVSPYFLNLVKSTETLTVFSQIGVAFLLFIVGLSLSPKVIKEVGKVSLITGLGQILFTSLLGFFIGKLLGFSNIVSFYLATALSLSSTIIIMKLLSDKKDLEKLYGKISVGFLLVQDLFVIALLMIITSFSGSSSSTDWTVWTVVNVLFSLLGLILASIYILPKLSKFFAKSQEFLFVFSIGWGLGLAALFHYFGFSMEVGALVAGISLSTLPYHFEISSKMKPLRDFFVIIFFVLLGSQMSFDGISNIIIPAIVFSLFILIGNPLVVIILMGILGYKRKVGFQAGLIVSQISEFSLILIALGVSIGHLSKEILSLVTIIGIITISGSTYLISYSDKIYSHVSRFLGIFERKKTKEEVPKKTKAEIILFGYNRIGFDILRAFKKFKEKILVVDYNPDTIKKLKMQGVNCRYGDVDDDEFLNELELEGAKTVISTIPNFDTNALLITKVKESNENTVVMVVSHNIDDANALYEIGATYVIMPHFLGGNHISNMFDKYGFKAKSFTKERNAHIKYLKEKKIMGHEHPKAERDI